MITFSKNPKKPCFAAISGAFAAKINFPGKKQCLILNILIIYHRAKT